MEVVFPGVEHRKCMRHLVTNFKKNFPVKFYDDHLWPASLTCSKKKYVHHVNEMYKENKLVQEYMEAHHGKLWSRGLFNEICKVDYVTNNLAECFNSKIKSLKGLLIWQIFDKLRQMLMVKIDLRRRIAESEYVVHDKLPSVIKALHAKDHELNMSIIRCSKFKADVTYTDRKMREWRYPVDLQAGTCSCRRWQITGKPCIHAMYFITTMGGE